MNLTKYDIFFKVLETKTISQAAKELGYSQSAVSQTIKSLEEELEIEIPDEDAEKFKTVGDVVEYINSHSEQ